MRQAKLLYQLAEAEGRPYQPEAVFFAAPQVVESVFSTPEVARELSREILLDVAKRHWVCSPKPGREEAAKAAAVASAPESSDPSGHRPPANAHRPPTNTM